MKKYKPEELEKGKIYEDTCGLWKFIKERYGDFIFIEVRLVEDEEGNIEDWNNYIECGKERILKKSELEFY